MNKYADETMESMENGEVAKAEWDETAETEWLELAESDLEGEALLPVQVHLQRVLQRVGAPMAGSPRDLYHIFAGSGASPLRQLFDIVVMPGATPADTPRSGDLLLRRISGHGYVHLAFIASNDMLPAQQAISRGWTLETLRPGYYTVVIEAGPNPHRAAQRYARLVLDGHGLAPANHIVLRPRRRAAETEQAEAIVEVAAAETGQVEAAIVEAEAAEYDEGDLHEDLLEADDELAENNPPPTTPAHAPAAVPAGSPVPFAPVPAGATFWPIITNHSLGRTVSFLSDTNVTVGRAARRFMANRSGGGRNHAGIDLFANFDDPVVAIADGEIVNFFGFCCGDNKTTSALLVAHANVVVNYGEVAPDSLRRNGLHIGSRVAAGQTIAFVGRNPGGSSMIHFETYVPGSRRNARWLVGQPHPASLLNPTRLLLHLQQHGQAGVRGGATPTTPGQPTPAPSPGGAINRRSPDYTRWVQSSLNKVMNAGLLVDGVRGPRTRAAIRAFQQSKGLTVDGIVGTQTEAALVAAGAPPPLTVAPVTAPREPATESEAQPTMDFAEASDRRVPDYIRWVQSSLNRLMNASLAVDGVSGRQTRAAVAAFQQSRGLPASGVVDQQVEAALIAAGAPPPSATPTTPPSAPPSPLPSNTPATQPATPAGVGRAVIRDVPLLRRHRGTRPDLILRWNTGQTAPSQVDVVVHLHGYHRHGRHMSLSRDIERISGLDFANPDDPNDSSPGRQRPTLGILPRGNYFGGQTGRGYNFPALTTPTGLRALIDFSLAHFGRQVGAEQVQMGRLILTAHSGGGAALMRILEHNDPDEVHVFDALYGGVSPLIQWTNLHLQRDQAALAAATDPQRYAREQAGALRVFYVADTRPQVNSLVVQRFLTAANLPAGLSQRYRVEASPVSHNNIPRRFGWRLLADAGSNLPQTRDAPAGGAAPREAVAESMDPYSWPDQVEGELFDEEPGDQYETLAENYPQLPVLQTISHAGPYRLAYDRLTTLGVIEPLPGRHTRRFRGTAALQATLNTWAPYIQQVMQPPAYILTGGLTVNKPGEHGRGNAIDIDGFWWSDTNSFLAAHAPTDWYRYLTIEATLRKAFGTVLNYDYNAAHHDHWHCDLGRPTTWRAARSQVNFVQRALKEIWRENLAVNGQWDGPTQAAARRNGYDLSQAGEWDHFLDDIIRRQSTPSRIGHAAQPGVEGSELEATDFASGTVAEQAQGENWCQIRRRISTVGLVENARWTAPNGNKRRENEAAMRPRLEAYWRAVPGVDAAVMAQRSAIDAEEWSAAFICFVMQSAGVRAAHGFVFGQRHMLYIVGALRNRERSDRDRPFWLYDLIEAQQEATPQIGDLLCANRENQQGVISNHSYASLRREWWVNNPQAEPTGRSHCNLVVDIVTRGNRRFLQVVGGNRAIPGAGTRGLTVRVSEVEINQQGAIVNPAAQNLFGIIKLVECSDFS